jgi:uncharacterized membrane protein
MAFCNMCGAQIADGTTTCAACASRIPATPAGTPAAAAAGMADNVAGMLAYITIIPAILFLVLEPYNRSRFVRFHAWQNIFIHVGLIVLWIAWFIVSLVLGVIPILGHLLALLLWIGLVIGIVVVWVVLLIKANAGQTYKLPFIGDLAEKQANAM